MKVFLILIFILTLSIPITVYASSDDFGLSTPLVLGGLSIIYVIMIITLGVIIFGFVMSDVWITSLGSMGLIIIGVYAIIQGINGENDWMTKGVSVICIGFASYIFIRGMYEKFSETEEGTI